jgi:hypothetical protein
LSVASASSWRGLHLVVVGLDGRDPLGPERTGFALEPVLQQGERRGVSARLGAASSLVAACEETG